MDVDEQPLRRPRTVDTVEYVKARVQQIAELLEVVDNAALRRGEVTSGPRTLFQRLPRHMRRRAMSHNVKRLPRTLRPVAARHTAKTAHRKKPPSRRWRRRPSRMLKRLVRESRKGVWLETHIWHAKRFRMQQLWGYKLPMCSYQRGFRPNYRCAVRSSVILDQSYTGAFQFHTRTGGQREELAKLLSAMFCHSTVSATFSNPMALEGRVEQTSMLYAAQQYPRGCIGPALFSWTPNSLNLWIHPAMEERLVKELAKHPRITIVPRNQTGKELAGKPNEQGGCGDKFKVVNLRNRLGRFHLIGPRSLAHLFTALKLVSDQELSSQERFAELKPMHDWWRACAQRVQPGCLRSGTVIALLVEDPRLFRAASSFSNTQQQHQSVDERGQRPSTSAAEVPPAPSPLFWDLAFYQQQLLPQRLSHAQFERLTAKRLAFSKRTDFKIPVLVIVRPVSTLNAVGANRVDFVCPPGVAYDFWLALQFANTRPIGVADKWALDAESGHRGFPQDCADSAAGRAFAEQEANALQAKHERKPRNRRVQYERELRVPRPFHFAWEQLLAEHSDTATKRSSTDCGWFVLRDRRLLQSLRNGVPDLTKHELLRDHHNFCLVPVSLRMLSRGVPHRLALICAPNETDLQHLAQSERAVIVEEGAKRKKADEGEEKGKETEKPEGEAQQQPHIPEFLPLDSSFPHLVSLNALFPDVVSKEEQRRQRNQRKRCQRREKKKAKREKSEKKEASTNAHLAQVEMAEQEGEECLPKRCVIGRVVRGDRSFVSTKGLGLGFIALNALQHLGSDPQKRIVLVRNVSSRYYHAAVLDVNLMP